MIKNKYTKLVLFHKKKIKVQNHKNNRNWYKITKIEKLFCKVKPTKIKN